MSGARKAIIFANTKSGGARSFLRAVKSLQAVEIDVDSARFNLSRDVIAVAVDEATERGINFVIAFGGDGTAGAVVDAIVGKDVVLGIIAAGTSNNFARSLGISPGVKGSIEALTHGREVTIPVGSVNGRYFAHAAIMGLNVEFAHRSQILRRYIGRLSYPVASLLVYRHRRSFSVTVQDITGIREFETYQLAVLNTSEFGGPLQLDPVGMSVADHELQVLTVHDLRLRTVVRGLPGIFFRRHLGLPGADTFRITEAKITTLVPNPITLDGEIGTRTPATVCIVPNALRVIVGPEMPN